MAESIGDLRRVNKNVLLRDVANADVTVGTSTTTLVSALDVLGFETKSVTVSNKHPTEDIFVKVWASNVTSPGTLAGSDWAVIGTEQTVIANTQDVIQWTTPSKWVGVTATGAASATGNDVYMLAKTL